MTVSYNWSMTTIYLVRHGEYENPQKLIPFRLPGFPLSALGKKQAAKLGNFFQDKNISAIYTSPITRCYQTAEIIANSLQIKPRLDQNIIEVKSPFQGMPLTKFEQILKNNSLYSIPSQIAQGETPEEILTRMKKALDEILVRYPDENIIVVSHGDPIMALVGKLGKPCLPKGGFFKLEFSGKKLLRANLFKSC